MAGRAGCLGLEFRVFFYILYQFIVRVIISSYTSEVRWTSDHEKKGRVRAKAFSIIEVDNFFSGSSVTTNKRLK